MPINPPVATLSDLQYVDFALTDPAGVPIPATWSIAPPTGAGTLDANSGRYIAPAIIAQPQDVTITATPAGGPASMAIVTLKPAAVVLIPTNVALRANETQQFVARVIGDPQNAVQWVIAPGHVIPAGLYTAPPLITENQTITVTAMSVANPTRTATATLRLLPAPLEWWWVAGIGVYLLLLVFILAFLLVAVWPPPVVDKTNLEKATAARVAAESVVKQKDLEARKAGEQAIQSSASAEKADTDQATKDQVQKDQAAAEEPSREKAEAESTLAKALLAEQVEANKIANALEERVSTPLGKLAREIDLLLLALIAGALGTCVHITRSYVDFVGNRTLRGSWSAWYLLYPFIGAALALIFYIALRGGFLTTGTRGTDVNPYGIVALAGLVGMFTKQATDKLGEVFSTLFKTDKEKELKDKLNPS